MWAPSNSSSCVSPFRCRVRRRSARELALAAIVLFVAFVFYLQQPFAPVAASSTAIERGRLVYVAEDCARCHTHDAHPGTEDTINRRQGPDLSRGRRSPFRTLAQNAPLQSARSERLVHHAVLRYPLPKQKRQRSGCLSCKSWRVYEPTAHRCRTTVASAHRGLRLRKPRRRAKALQPLLRHLPQCERPHTPQVAIRIHRVSSGSRCSRNYRRCHAGPRDHKAGIRPHRSLRADHQIRHSSFRHGRTRAYVRQRNRLTEFVARASYWTASSQGLAATQIEQALLASQLKAES